MFMPARWRSEKNKIKAVFKLQFHATQVPQMKVDGLMLSVVPGDVGKPTSRLEKAVVRDGCCRWENSVYETVKLVQDPKTGKISQKIYHFIVSTTVSTNAGLFGEVSINFADFADAIKASYVSLPLKNSNSKGVLHVTIQRHQENVDPQREVEESENPEDHTWKSHLSSGDNENITSDSPEDEPFNKAAQNAELRRRASMGSDSAMSSSESISELNTPREPGVRANNIQQGHPSFGKSLSHQSVLLQPAPNVYQEPQISESEWSGSSDPGISTDDSTREISRNSSDVEIEKLKAEFVALTRQVDLSELELQSVRKQIVKESKRGQDLLREVTSLKEERDYFKSECERLKVSEKRMDEAKVKNKLQFEGGDPWVLLEEMREEVNYEKDLNSNLRLQLQKTQESNTELILAVQDLEAMLEQKNKETADISVTPGFSENNQELMIRTSCRSESDEDEDQKALEELVKVHRDAKETYLLEQKIKELDNEIEIYKRDRDELEIQLEQLALDYEILKQENHDISYKLEQSQLQEQLKMQYECSSSLVNVNELENQVESLEYELKKQSEEYSESLVRIKELETQIESLEEELEKEAQMFESATHAKVEQEQRAIRAEEGLRKTRWKNASVAEKLQEEFRRLSEQMAAAFDANEKMAMKAMTEAHELHMQKHQLAESLQDANTELQTIREDYEAKLHELSELVSLKTNQIEQVLGDLDAKSEELENQTKHQEDVTADLSQEILRLKNEIESLRKDKNFLGEQAKLAENLSIELEVMKISIKEAEALAQRGNIERNELETTILSMKKESERLVMEMQEMRHIENEKETAVTHLRSELEAVIAQCNDLKQSLFEDEMEKEKLRKQVVQLKGDLKKKEETLINVEKKLKDSNVRAAVSNGTKTGLRNNKTASVTHGSKEVTSLKERIKVLEGQIKMKESAFEVSTNSFLEKEKDLENKIEELMNRLEELNQNSATLCEYQSQEGLTIISNRVDSVESGITLPSNKSDNLDDLLTELASLKESNKSMESELKEMQERYSEISLKFAEVEGERQKLVMTVRNLKNAKKR